MNPNLLSIRDPYSEQLRIAGIPVSGQMHIALVTLLSVLLSIPAAVFDLEFSVILFLISEFVGLLLAPRLLASTMVRRRSKEALTILAHFTQRIRIGESATEALLSAINLTKAKAFEIELKQARDQLTRGVPAHLVLMQLGVNTPGVIAQTIFNGMSFYLENNSVEFSHLEELSKISISQFKKNDRISDRLALSSLFLQAIFIIYATVLSLLICGVLHGWSYSTGRDLVISVLPAFLMLAQLYYVAMIRIEVWNG